MNSDTRFLKMVGLISMIIDHIGAILFPDVVWLRYIGRLAFPLFIYCATVSFQYTHNFKYYVFRLLLCGLISQPIYTVAFSLQFLQLNIMFTLALGLGALWAVCERRLGQLILFLFLSFLLPIEYGPFAVLLMLIFYLLRDDKKPCIFLSVLLCLIWYWGTTQLFMLLAFPLIFIQKAHFKISDLDKRIFYIFYPIHLSILSLLRFSII